MLKPERSTPTRLFGISGAKVFVLVPSESAVASPHVGKEVERASSKKRAIIALRIDAAPLTPALAACKPHSYKAGATELDTEQGTIRESECQLSRLSRGVHLRRPCTSRFRSVLEMRGVHARTIRGVRGKSCRGDCADAKKTLECVQYGTPEALAFGRRPSSSPPNGRFMELLR